MLGYNPVKFGGCRHSDIEDIVVLVCQVILQDHMIKGSCDFTGTNLLRYYNLARFDDHRCCRCGDIMILVFHKILIQ